MWTCVNLTGNHHGCVSPILGAWVSLPCHSKLKTDLQAIIGGMASTYVQHTTLITGHSSQIRQGDVSGEAVARIVPWLSALIESGQSLPLPVADLSEYSGHASVLDGALIVTISGPPPKEATGMLASKAAPMVTVGVARKSRHAHLWTLMTQSPPMPAVHRSVVKCPQAPWCAVAIWPTIDFYPEATSWLGDFERCIAWAWVQTQ